MIRSPHWICRSGETGRHAAFRSLWVKARGGSSPLFGKSNGEQEHTMPDKIRRTP